MIIADTTPIPCLHSCDGNCLTSKQLCDNQYDCTDRSDEPIVCRKQYYHCDAINHIVLYRSK